MDLVILSSEYDSYQAKRLFEEVQERYEDSVVVHPSRLQLEISGESEVYSDLGVDFNKIKGVIPRINPDYTMYGGSLIRYFEGKGVFSTISSEALRVCRDEIANLIKMNNLGVSTPRTLVARNWLDQNQIQEYFEGKEVLLKGLSGNLRTATLKIKSLEELEKQIIAIEQLNGRYALQEVIQGPNSAVIEAMIVNNKIISCIEKSGGYVTSNEPKFLKNFVLQEREEEIIHELFSKYDPGVYSAHFILSEGQLFFYKISPCPDFKKFEVVNKTNVAKEIVKFAIANID